MSFFRPAHKSRFALLVAGAATVAIAACDTSLSFRPNELLWGFVNVAALETGAGEIRTAPVATFFRGEVTSVPSSALRPDSCFPVQNYVPPNNSFSGVAYLDAGASVQVSLGARTGEVPRVSAAGVTNYALAAGTTLAYTPGDSVVVSIPGANGGYPAAEIRAKTAEAFVLQPVEPASEGAVQLRWNAASDTNSSMVISLQFAPQGSTQITREIRCAFRDDGRDSILFNQHQPWSASTNALRAVVATRLRTLLRNVGDGGLQMISTYQHPVPKQ